MADDRHAAAFDAMVQRRAAGEPLQYVLGQWGFRTLDLYVDPRVLIPRPETEVVAGLAIDAVPTGGRVVDLGTGSGAIALSIAAERWPDVEVWATDASADALAVARANLAGLGRRAGVVRLAEGDWFAALPDGAARHVRRRRGQPALRARSGALVARQVRDHEPHLALFGGDDGLDHVRRIVAEAPTWLRPGGALVVEIGEDQGASAVVGLADGRRLRRRTASTRTSPSRDRALVARLTC